MELLKWYSIILITLGLLTNAYLGIKTGDNKKLISFVFLIPIFIYLVLVR